MANQRVHARSRFTQARNALLWGLGFFALLQIGLAIVIECGLWKYRDPFYEHKVVHLRRRLPRHPGELERPGKVIVMLGSSRTGNGVKGTLLEEALPTQLGQPVTFCNLGVPGAGPLVELMNFQRLKREGIRPDVVLIEVMPVFLAGQAFWERNLIQADRLSSADIDWLKCCDFPVSPVWSDWWQFWPVPWYQHRFSIVSDWMPKLLPGYLQQTWAKKCDATGWVPIPDANPSAEQRQRSVERARLQYQPPLHDFRLGGPSAVALGLLLDECRQADVQPVLVLLPEAASYQSWYGPGAWAQVESYLGALQREFGVPIINARSWVPDEELCDSHHLLPAGADRFTRRLARELAAILSKSGRGN